MAKALLLVTFYLLGGVELSIAADASKRVLSQNGEVDQSTFSEAAARNALSLGDDLYCARVASGERQPGEYLSIQGTNQGRTSKYKLIGHFPFDKDKGCHVKPA